MQETQDSAATPPMVPATGVAAAAAAGRRHPHHCRRPHSLCLLLPLIHPLCALLQNLVEYISRQKIYDSTYWKQECFGLSAERLVDKAVELKEVGAGRGRAGGCWGWAPGGCCEWVPGGWWVPTC